jgi:hypothetical protein
MKHRVFNASEKISEVSSRFYYNTLFNSPVGVLSDFNYYRYVQNNPINLFDPNGLKSKCMTRCTWITGVTCGFSAVAITATTGQLWVGIMWEIWCSYMTQDICRMECEYRELTCPAPTDGEFP